MSDVHIDLVGFMVLTVAVVAGSGANSSVDREMEVC